LSYFNTHNISLFVIHPIFIRNLVDYHKKYLFSSQLFLCVVYCLTIISRCFIILLPNNLVIVAGNLLNLLADIIFTYTLRSYYTHTVKCKHFNTPCFSTQYNNPSMANPNSTLQLRLQHKIDH